MFAGKQVVHEERQGQPSLVREHRRALVKETSFAGCKDYRCLLVPGNRCLVTGHLRRPVRQKRRISMAVHFVLARRLCLNTAIRCNLCAAAEEVSEGLFCQTYPRNPGRCHTSGRTCCVVKNGLAVLLRGSPVRCGGKNASKI